MSVKPGVSTKRTISKANGISGGVGSETLNVFSPIEAGRQVLSDGLSARSETNATSL
jgi:hypothetical protein